MSETFAPRALALYALAARALGWRPDDFWSATPAELAAAFAPVADREALPLSRDELHKLMETDHG